jgi:hypothetical protein
MAEPTEAGLQSERIPTRTSNALQHRHQQFGQESRSKSIRPNARRTQSMSSVERIPYREAFVGPMIDVGKDVDGIT